MKLLIISFIAASVFIAGSVNKYNPSPASNDPEIAMCGTPAKDVAAGEDGKFISALKGWGSYHYPISTRNDSAQFYFDQGLSLYYSYHFPDAVASFKEAARFDPSCAMTYWGQALARGPYYNIYYYKMPKDVPGMVEDMKKYAPGGNDKEKALVEAMSRRYSNDMSNADRLELDKNYGDALSSLVRKYPDDINIKALYIDAVMLQHRWDFWGTDGKPRPWTNEVVTMCEQGLQKEQHPALLHYYIHVTEASRQPGRALAAADRLKDQLPGVAHMVHMSSHMYQRNGLYTKGVDVNDDAVEAGNTLDKIAPSLGYGQNKAIHYFAVQSYCAMTAGMYGKGLRIYQRARDRQVAVNPDFLKETYAQFVYMMPTIALARLGKWDEILASEKPDETWKYAVVLDNFARGMAFIAKKDLASAEKSLSILEDAMKEESLKVRFMPFNSPIQSCKIAADILRGRLQFEKGKKDEAIAAFKRAVEEQDNMIYREPQDWLIPARQYLGMYLLRVGKPAEAEAVYREDLIHNPGNGWSLTGLSQSLKAQNKPEGASVETQAKKACADADVVITASVF